MITANILPTPTDLAHLAQWVGAVLLVVIVLLAFVRAVIWWLDALETRRQRRLRAAHADAVLAQSKPLTAARERQLLDAYAKVDSRHARVLTGRVIH